MVMTNFDHPCSSIADTLINSKNIKGMWSSILIADFKSGTIPVRIMNIFCSSRSRSKLRVQHNNQPQKIQSLCTFWNKNGNMMVTVVNAN